MQIGNQAFMATDWASLHREKMTESGKVQDNIGTEDGSGEEVSFQDTFKRTRGVRMTGRVNGEHKAPYDYLADDSGIIHYNGVTFVCDFKKNALCLGDVSNKKNCICVGLSEGGSLMVNRDNLDDLARAIGMFSPEDVNRIMRAIAQDKKCQEELQKIEDEKNSVGDEKNNVSDDE